MFLEKYLNLIKDYFLNLLWDNCEDYIPLVGALDLYPPHVVGIPRPVLSVSGHLGQVYINIQTYVI